MQLESNRELSDKNDVNKFESKETDKNQKIEVKNGL